MSALLGSWLALAGLFTLVALQRLLRRPAARPAPRTRAALMLRPVDAPTEEELENLAAPVGGVESIVLSPFRPRLAAGLGWLPSDPLGHNRKLGHLQYALATVETGGRPVLVVDADVRVDDALVDSLLGALEAGAELAWAAPRPAAQGVVRGLLVQSLHSFAVLDALGGGAKPVCGKAIALSPRALAVLRGLPDCLGEDLELAKALHAQQLPVVFAGQAVMPGPAASWRVAAARFTRWMQVLRAHRPLLFPTIPLLFACTPVLLAGAVLEGSAPAIAGVLALIAARGVLAAVLERRAGLFFGWFAAELLLLACWVQALVLGSRVTWRGRVMEVGLQGRLSGPGVAQ